MNGHLDFEEQTFGNNSDNRLKLYQALYPPNDFRIAGTVCEELNFAVLVWIHKYYIC